MRIALLGYGKMGQLIEKMALQRGHEISVKIGAGETEKLTPELLHDTDIAIDFSAPSIVLDHIYVCFAADLPVIVGTTGWYGNLQEVKNDCLQRNNTLLYGSNFSIGVNVFFQVNRYLAKLMNNYKAYDVQVEEIHHTQKLDSPSGTAMTIAEDIIELLNQKKEWVNQLADSPQEQVIGSDQLLIESHRIENVPGTHTVVYSSEVDEIELKHTAHNRNGFALGAVLAAEWLENKQGFYSVNDVFKIQ
ncbi:MAG: 4-hydroxy-tetrahydrodipicolinate reductase [Pedobacter sp.]|nr:MAG: 4-hydroxy-tetrahydrodipicolinate reductase [Pedobacter sp.]